MIDKLFREKREKTLDAPDAGLEDNDVGSLAANSTAGKRQQILLYSLLGTFAIGGMGYILAPSTKDTAALENVNKSTETKVATDDMVNRSLNNKEWMALSEGQQQETANQIKGLQGQAGRMQGLEAQIQALQSEKGQMTADGTRVLGAYETENQQLKAALAAAQRAPQPGPSSLYGAGAPSTYRPQGAQGLPGAAPGSALAAATGAAQTGVRSNEIKLVSFGDSGGTAIRIARGTTSFTDSANYLPPNSIAKARVIVGVDATTSVKSQNDPLPVVLRITGAARSVFADGKLLRTNIEGCMVNGAAQGDLSSEKVFVKLQRMTCPQPGGRFAVSEVKGFIAFGGKTGVRGRVVSREGGLVSQAFIAGLAGGFGRGFSANAQSLLTGPQVTVGGQRQQLGLGDIAQGGIGEGISTSADTVSKYLIERAEQYQPVIEMPTGIEVEIVFLDGVFIRN